MLGTHHLFQPWQSGVMADKTHKFLAAHRKARGLTSEELARELGTSKPTISRLENHGAAGAKKTLDWWLNKIADFYKISVDELSESPNVHLPLTDSSQSGVRGSDGEEKMGTQQWRRHLAIIADEVMASYGDTDEITRELLEIKKRMAQATRPQRRRRT